MSSPLIWIIFPLVVSGVLYVLRRFEKPVVFAGTALALLLAWLAWVLPLATTLSFGPVTLRVSESMLILGRRFLLDNGDRPTLALIFLAASFWFGGSYAARAGIRFVPYGLAVVSLMTATLAVEPFLYAALLIQIAVLLSIPILVSPGHAAGGGTLRFLTFQTLGVPFILFAGWLLAGAGVSPGELPQVVRATILLGIGFSFLLAVFPFHTWLPLVAEEANPYAAAFVFFMLPGISSIFGLTFIERFAWLRNSEAVYTSLAGVGMIMIATAGVWAAFQRDLGRMLGFAVMADIGLSILIIGSHGGPLSSPFPGSPNPSVSTILFFTIFLYRGLAMGTWALALSAIRRQSGNLRFRSVYGIGRKMPLAAATVILAHLSLAGFPLLGGFPVRLALLERLASESPYLTVWALLGALGLLTGALRTLAVLVMGENEEPWTLTENSSLRFYLTISLVVLVLSGLVPQIIR